MKKILFLIITCFLLTGCTVNYNLEIEGNTFNEKITGNVLNSEIELKEDQTDINMLNYLINSEQSAFYNNDIYYNKVLNNNNDRMDFDYTYSFDENNFINSRILNSCFENYSFQNKDNKYYISVYGDFLCAYANETKINITTKYKVTANNADKIKNNTYTWIINKDKKEDLSLFITIDKEGKKTNSNWSSLKTIGLIIIVILSAICIFIVKKKPQY